LAALWPADRLELACSLPLVELARKLDGCDGFIGHDSGITHLAAALGLRGVALWGETDQQVWRPQGGAIRVLREPGGLSALSVGRVLGEVLDFLPAPEHP
jgi:ADP-heptose:LPS heptosyltransferase